MTMAVRTPTITINQIKYNNIVIFFFLKWLRLVGNVILVLIYKKNFRLKSIPNLNSTVYCEICKCVVDNMSNSGRNINTHLNKKKNINWFKRLLHRVER